MRNQYSDLLKRAISYRQRMNMTQMEVSEELGITQGQFSKMEQGKTIYPHKVLCGLYAMKWDMDHIITGKEYSHTLSEVCAILENLEETQYQEMLGLVVWSLMQGLKKSKAKLDRELQVEVELLKHRANESEKNTLLYALRIISRVSQIPMSEKLGVNIKKYRMLERNEVNPDAELLMRIYEVTGCKPSLLLEPEKAEEMIINDLWNLVDIRFREEILILLKQGVSMLTK